jgi:WD40 repeat protein
VQLRKVLRIAKAIKEGRWKREPPKSATARPLYLLWEADTDAVAGYDGGKRRGPTAISAPKELPPGHASSYNPPPEYLLTDEEKKAWEECDPRERARRGMPSFLPVRFTSLRHVPLYKPGIRERFERCLDLYLCPRAVKDKLSISDPSTLLPKLPDPSELRPFPSTLGIDFRGGHDLFGARVRSISVDPTGMWLASCGDDKTVRLWDTMTGKCVRTWGTPTKSTTTNASSSAATTDAAAPSSSSSLFAEVPQQVAWCPNASIALIAVAEGNRIHLLYPGTALAWNAQTTFDAIRGARQGEAAAAKAGSSKDDEDDDSSDDGDSSDEEGETSDSGSEDENQDAAAIAKRKLEAAKAKKGGKAAAARKTVALDDEGEMKEEEEEEEEGESSDSDSDAHSDEDGKKGKKAKGSSESALTSSASSASSIPVRKAKWTQSDKAFPLTSAALLRRPGALGGSSDLYATSLVTIEHSHQVKKLSWQAKGDYLVAVLPNASSGSVMVHQISRRASTSPFTKAHGIPQAAMFHPTKPLLYVANQHNVRVWDLATQELETKLEAGVKWLSTIDIHPSGDHLICGSFDARTVWFDTTLSQKPFKTLKYHDKGVRRAIFHRSSPLMATASDDGTLHVFHARVFDGPEDEFGKNPLIVPLKVLRGHAKTSEGLGVLDAVFHPTQPWLFSCGADGTIKLWHSLP